MGTRTHRVGHGDAEELVARPRCSSDSLHPNASGEQAAVSIDWLQCERCRERQAQTAMWCMVMAASCGAIDGDAASQLGLADNASARNRRRHVPSTCPCPHPTMSTPDHVFAFERHSRQLGYIPGSFRRFRSYVSVPAWSGAQGTLPKDPWRPPCSNHYTEVLP